MKFLLSQTFKRIGLIFNVCCLGDNVSSWRYSLVILKRDLIFMGGRVEFVGGIRTPCRWKREMREDGKKGNEENSCKHFTVHPEGVWRSEHLPLRDLYIRTLIYFYTYRCDQARRPADTEIFFPRHDPIANKPWITCSNRCAQRVSNKIYAIFFTNFLIIKFQYLLEAMNFNQLSTLLLLFFVIFVITFV